MKIGIVNDATAADRIAAAFSALDALTVSDVATSAERSVDADVDVVVTVGERALGAVVVTGESRPILPLGISNDSAVDADASLSAAADTVERLAARDSVPTTTHRPLQVAAGDDTTTAVCDCALLTTEPARISEYEIHTDGRPLARFRADGVVAATPLGSAGYGRAAGGPRLAPETGVAVTPVAPFATKADDWVLSPPLSVTVERDDDVTVYADSRRFVSGSAGLSVSLAAGAPFSVVDTTALVPPQQLEKL